MATLFVEGFDKYGQPGEVNPDVSELMIQGEWTSHGTTPVNIAAGLSHTGYSLYSTGGTESWVSRTLPAFSARLIGGFRFVINTGGVSFAPLIAFRDVGVQQCALRVNVDGTITLLRGDYFFSNVDLATSGASVSFGVTHYLEFDIAFGDTANYTIYLDGGQIMTGTADTKVTANASANGIVIGNNSGLNSTFPVTFDDLYIFDTTGAHNNAVLLTCPRIETRYPNSDVSADFTNVATIFGTKNSVYNGADAPGVTLFLQRYTANVSHTINSVSCVPTVSAATAKFKAVLYSDSAGLPNSRLSTGTEVTGTTAQAILTGDLSTPTALTNGTAYWVGFITDSSVALRLADNLNQGFKAANVYASGAPATAPVMTQNVPSWVLWGNCTGAATNWSAVAVNPAPANYARISSDNVGDADLYGFPPLHADEATIYCVAVKGNFKRSDTGPRTIDLKIVSGASSGSGDNAGITSGSDYGWEDTHFERDPDGGVAWSLAAANAINAGPSVAS